MAPDVTPEELTRQVAATLTAAARESALSIQLWAILACIAERPGLSVREVVARLGVHKSVVSLGVEELVRAGLVTRDKDPADRRLVRLTLAPAGKAMLQRVERSAHPGQGGAAPGPPAQGGQETTQD